MMCCDESLVSNNGNCFYVDFVGGSDIRVGWSKEKKVFGWVLVILEEASINRCQKTMSMVGIIATRWLSRLEFFPSSWSSSWPAYG